MNNLNTNELMDLVIAQSLQGQGQGGQAGAAALTAAAGRSQSAEGLRLSATEGGAKAGAEAAAETTAGAQALREGDATPAGTPRNPAPALPQRQTHRQSFASAQLDPHPGAAGLEHLLLQQQAHQVQAQAQAQVRKKACIYFYTS